MYTRRKISLSFMWKNRNECRLNLNKNKIHTIFINKIYGNDIKHNNFDAQKYWNEYNLYIFLNIEKNPSFFISFQYLALEGGRVSGT